LRAGHPGDLGLAVSGEDGLAVGVELGHTQFDQAHAAVTGDGKLGVITIVGNKFGCAAGGLDRVEALGKFHPDAIDLHVKQRGIGGRAIVVKRIHGAQFFRERLDSSGTERCPCAGPATDRHKDLIMNSDQEFG